MADLAGVYLVAFDDIRVVNLADAVDDLFVMHAASGRLVNLAE